MIDTRKLSRRGVLVQGSLALGFFVAGRHAVAYSRSLSLQDGGSNALFGQAKRIVEELRLSGQPLPEPDAARVLALSSHPTGDGLVEIERILDGRTLVRVTLDKYGVGTSVRGGAPLDLLELGWRSFLVRVENPARLTGAITLISRSTILEGDLQPGIHASETFGNDVPEIVRVGPDIDTDYGYGRQISQWMGYRFGAASAAARGLEGAPVEYVVLQIYSQLGGSNTAPIALGSSILQSSYRLHDCTGFTARFSSTPASIVRIGVRDWDGAGAMASLLIRDEVGRLYPAPAHRLEPDLGYQPQIYRADGESIRLPVGRYTVIAQRGPEYLECHRDLVVWSGDASSELAIDLERWIHPARLGWHPGDPHVHPEGQHYGIVSKYGLAPETMIRQVRGEALSVGSILIWTNGYYYQKQFLTGRSYQPTNALPFPDAQRANNTSLTPRATPHDHESVIQYDVEQAAFPSNRLGHPILLRLKHHDFPGARSIHDWPSWNLPIFQWARAQGAVGGYAHIGRTTDPGFTELPNYDIPGMDDIGANECLVDVTHGLVDFVAGCKNQAAVELNLWYHLLNCGFRLPLIGETDFVSWNARVGAGRTYVKLEDGLAGDAVYDAWVEGIKAGQLYVGDGRSHLIDFRVNGQLVGNSPLELPKRARVTVTANVAARLEPTPFDVDERLRKENVWQYWHIERARMGTSRMVALEVVMNGQVVERREIVADGTLRSISFTIDVPHSGWIALRVLPSAHTAPIYVSVGGQPVRASRRSAQWCLDCVEVLWSKHANRIRESERVAAAAAWDHARAVYRRIISESDLD